MVDKKKDSGKFDKPAFDEKSLQAAKDAMKNGKVKISTDEIKFKKK